MKRLKQIFSQETDSSKLWHSRAMTTAVLEEQAGIDILLWAIALERTCWGMPVKRRSRLRILLTTSGSATWCKKLCAGRFALCVLRNSRSSACTAIGYFGADIVKLKECETETVSSRAWNCCLRSWFTTSNSGNESGQGKSFAQAKELLQQALRLEKLEFQCWYWSLSLKGR